MPVKSNPMSEDQYVEVLKPGEGQYVENLKPGEGPSERQLFDQAAELIEQRFELRLNDSAFQDALTKAEGDSDDIEHARERAAYLRELLELLTSKDAGADLKPREREVLHDAEALAVSSASNLLTFLTSLSSPAEKGDALGAIGDLVEAAFYIGRCSTVAREAALKKLKKPRGPIEKLRCREALAALYASNPVSQGIHRTEILAKVVEKASTPISLATLDRAIKEVWPDEN